MNNDDRKHYLALLRALKLIYETDTGKATIDQRKTAEARALLLKHFYHAASAFYLSGRTKVPVSPDAFTDHATINVVARAAIESVLAFFYLFADDTSHETKDMRYWSWLIGGYSQRLRYDPELKVNIEKKTNEKIKKRILVGKLRVNSEYKNLDGGKRKSVIEGEWPLDKWTDIGKQMGLPSKIADNAYGFLCKYAHSEALSVWQMRVADEEVRREQLTSVIFDLLRIVMAFMVQNYISVFPRAEAALLTDHEAHQTFKYCILINTLLRKSELVREIVWTLRHYLKGKTTASSH